MVCSLFNDMNIMDNYTHKLKKNVYKMKINENGMPSVWKQHILIWALFYFSVIVKKYCEVIF